MKLKDYQQIDAVNWSTLKHFFKSPAHVRHHLDQVSLSTAAQKLGTLQHLAILEPEAFSRVKAYDKLDGRTKEGKEQAAEIKALEESGQMVIERGDFERIRAMSAAVYKHQDASMLLKKLEDTERAIVWEDQGVMCKGLIDGYSESGGFILDIKTTQRDCRFWSFQAEAARFNYFGQAAFYLRGLKKLDTPVNDHLWIVIESEPPHGVAVYQLSEVTAAVCQSLIDSFLDKWRTCVALQKWPSYDEPIQALDAPENYFRKIENN